MRAAIRQQLINKISKIQERVYEPHAANAKTPKPYLVIRQGAEVEDTPWTNFRRIMEVWPYLSRTSFQGVDGMVSLVVAALDKQLLTTENGEVFSCVYLGNAGADFVDDGWDAITRGLRFAVMALQPVSVAEAENDPWLETLAIWTEALLGEAWTVYRSRWPLGYKRPAILWRIAGIQEPGESLGAVALKVRKTLAGHVLGTNSGQEINAVVSIVQEMTKAVKIPLDLTTRQYMTVDDVKGDCQSDPLARGQITLTLSRIVRRPIREAPILKELLGTGNIQ
ncbi:hypothetical protein Dtox_4239 [Desulfofarcimen acetoxidans DSM 771]|uniref:Uncharacterized protein n=1 Tax=Desulfofarcimen acetoxidans (strain ATCC 49208 / DSM 771 / KCTC 5769 / VKM B-1644 / 5575) TaxID=485916 RepID=C8VZG1_DESAS|nr:hypothetical protein [Desulfofarcimen acetoxidans]ACV64906.1 hypothetical protein Dtox_4239 [Desulfofarcimen acetoxidans DSM 771]